MKPLNLLTAIAATLLAIIPLSLQAQDKNISEWKFGKTVFGTDPTEDNLKGKVVVIEYWGVN